jgi:hypothetical protein
LYLLLSLSLAVAAARFDDPNLVSAAGVVPVMRLAAEAGLADHTAGLLTVPTDKGANPGGKVTALVCGMVAGADSIDDMALLRHGAMTRVFDRSYAPSTLGSFLRQFTFGHVRQLDAVASRFLTGLAGRTELLADDPTAMVLVDVDDSIIEVHGHAKQGASFGYTRVRGLNMLIATASTHVSAPIVVAQRLRKGSCGSPRGAKRLVADALKTVRTLRPGGPVLLRADSAFYGSPTIGAAVRGGAQVSVTVRMTPSIKAAIASVTDEAWTAIEYTDAIRDETTGELISRAEVAEIAFTAFASAKKADWVPGRLVVRRIPDFNAPKDPRQASLFELWRFHAFFTTTDPQVLDTVAADKTHRGHAIIEQVHADLKNSALAHLPSGKFHANSAWLVLAVMAFNLTRAAGTLAGGRFHRATTGTIRRCLIHVAARIASSARRLTLHLPQDWPWDTEWTELFTRNSSPPASATA